MSAQAGRGRGGYTLIEVVISILLTAVMVSSVFSIALSTRAGGGKSDRKLLGAQGTKALGAALKGYVAESTAYSNTLIFGPNAANRGNTPQSWNIDTPGIQEDHACTITQSGTPAQVTSISIGAEQDVPAMNPGSHCMVCVAAPPNDAQCFVPKLLRDPPFNGVAFYTVTGTPPQVQIGMFWNEP